MSRGPTWAAYAASAWSFGYALLGLYWWSGGGGFPFAPIDLAHRSGSLLEGSPVGVVAPVMAGLGLAGAVVAVLMARRLRRDRLSGLLIVFGWVLAAGLTLVIPDYFLIAVIAFAPLLLVFTFTGVPGDQGSVTDILYWHRDNLVVLFIGGLLWAAATLAYQRRVRGACAYCGRRDGTGPSREQLLRWGRRAVLVACLAPVPYEVTRIAWALGYPLGITQDFLTMMQDTPGMLGVGVGCAVASIGGGVLTHGLVHRWGEVYPRWIWLKAGRRVPPALAVIPASLIAVVLIPAGLMNLRMPVSRSSWALNAPSILWLVWGVALGIATAAYHLRRRPVCRHCGQGTSADGEQPLDSGPRALAVNPGGGGGRTGGHLGTQRLLERGRE